MKKILDDESSIPGLVPGSTILVVGAGRTGVSVVKYLAGHGFDVVVTDSRDYPPQLSTLQKQFPDVELYLGGFSDTLFRNADCIVVSPGVALDEPLIVDAQSRNIPVIGDIELFSRVARAPVIAITGSNGKSTVTTLLAKMAFNAGREVRAGGNLGTPALDLLRETEPDLYVLELSSFQLESTFSLHPQAAVVLNVSADHLDRYRTVTEYAQAKAGIYVNAGARVINIDDPVTRAMAAGETGQIQFGVHQTVESGYGVTQHDGQQWLAAKGQLLIPVADLPEKNIHNLSNALAALALGDAAGLPREAMLQTLREFEGLPHRMQLIAEQDGICWYNDSKGTNVGATIAALSGMEQPLVLIAGGESKGADFAPLCEVVRDRVRAVVVFGRDGMQIRDALHGVVPVVSAGDLDEAVDQAARLAHSGDAVLLSPACASFDMFSGYEERGEVFVEAVRRHLS